MQPLKCFEVQQLGVYTWSFIALMEGTCPGHLRHRATVDRGVFTRDNKPEWLEPGQLGWPEKCDHCGIALTITQRDCHGSGDPHYKRVDTGEIIIGKLTAGAMFFEEEDTFYPKGPDGRALVVVLPTTHLHRWHVDSMASNCTVPCKCGQLYSAHNSNVNPHNKCPKFEPIDGGAHRCWIRHGEIPNIHVDKAGPTCNAGAGSIEADGWHGFCSQGYLQEHR